MLQRYIGTVRSAIPRPAVRTGPATGRVRPPARTVDGERARYDQGRAPSAGAAGPGGFRDGSPDDAAPRSRRREWATTRTPEVRRTGAAAVSVASSLGPADDDVLVP